MPGNVMQMESENIFCDPKYYVFINREKKCSCSMILILELNFSIYMCVCFESTLLAITLRLSLFISANINQTVIRLLQ